LGHALNGEDPELGVFVSDFPVFLEGGGSKGRLRLIDVLPLVHHHTRFGRVTLYAYRLATTSEVLGAASVSILPAVSAYSLVKPSSLVTSISTTVKAGGFPYA